MGKDRRGKTLTDLDTKKTARICNLRVQSGFELKKWWRT